MAYFEGLLRDCGGKLPYMLAETPVAACQEGQLYSDLPESMAYKLSSSQIVLLRSTVVMTSVSETIMVKRTEANIPQI